MDQKKVIKWGLLLGGGMVLLCCFPFTCVGIIGQMAENGRNNREMSAATPQVNTQPAPTVSQETNTVKVSNDTSQVSQPVVATPEPAPVDNTVAVGEAFTLGNYTYTVKRWKQVNQLGNQFMATNPVAGATFVILEYEITNNTNKTQVAMNSDFKLLDAKGREFRTSSKVETGLAMSDPNNKEFLISELQPGLTRTIRQGFEVPKDAVTAKGMILLVPEKGFMGTDEVRVRLE